MIPFGIQGAVQCGWSLDNKKSYFQSNQVHYPIVSGTPSALLLIHRSPRGQWLLFYLPSHSFVPQTHSRFLRSSKQHRLLQETALSLSVRNSSLCPVHVKDQVLTFPSNPSGLIIQQLYCSYMNIFYSFITFTHYQFIHSLMGLDGWNVKIK